MLSFLNLAHVQLAVIVIFQTGILTSDLLVNVLVLRNALI